MSRKIKFHSLHFLFRLFAWLADKSGGWRVFVRAKLILGSLILGLGLTVPKVVQAQNQNSPKKTPGVLIDSKKYDGVLCYEVIVTSTVDTTKIYQVIEQMPQFPGGEIALLQFITKNLTPQPMAQCYTGIQGKVICRFVVEKDGNVSNITVIRSLDTACDKEAVRILKLLPKFIPGKQNGKAVRVYYTVPVTFKLE